MEKSHTIKDDSFIHYKSTALFIYHNTYYISYLEKKKYWKCFPVYDRVQITYTESIQIHLFKKKEYCIFIWIKLFWNTTERAVQKKGETIH